MMPNARTLDPVYAHHAYSRQFQEDGHFWAFPDNRWDIVFLRHHDRVTVLRTGLTTRPDKVTYTAGDEILVISFRPQCVMPALPGDVMRNRGVLLELVGRRTFRVDSTSFEIPTLENADAFVRRLASTGVIEASPLVASMVASRVQGAAERTRQRHFLNVTGLTYKHFTMIERAQKAAALLRAGRPAVDVAPAVGFFDQAHMINSLKAIMGHTPGQIARSSWR